MSQLQKARAFLFPKFRQVFQFLTRQGIAMFGNLIYGLVSVRTLPVPDYAKFAVLFGFMGSLTVLLDIVVTGTLAPMVGERIDNLPLIANYVASIRRIALRTYLVIAPLAGLIFFLVIRKQQWSNWVMGQMIAVLLVTAWFARVNSSYGAVLILRRDRAHYYRLQIIGSLGSLGLLLLCWALHLVNIYVAILLNVAQILFMATAYFLRARKLLGVKGVASAEQQKAIVRLALPNAPNTLFYAIQGQITLMLITFFGHNVSSVASVGALARLGQILTYLSQMNPILVEPYFAKLNAFRLKRVYSLSILAVSLFAAGFATLAFLFPRAFLWILGPHYSELHVEVGLVILSSSIWYVSGFMYVVNTSRRFVYWWNNVANIVLTIGTQIVFILNFDLSIMRNVLALQVMTALLSALTNGSCALYGFWRGPKQIEAMPVVEIATS